LGEGACDAASLTFWSDNFDHQKSAALKPSKDEGARVVGVKGTTGGTDERYHGALEARQRDRIADGDAAILGGLCPWEPVLEFDTADNKFRDNLMAALPSCKGRIRALNRTVNL